MGVVFEEVGHDRRPDWRGPGDAGGNVAHL